VNRALFLDRDGTLIVDKVYLADPAGVELIAGSSEALRRARSLGFKLFLFTNQSGIGRGLHTLEDTHRVNARMEDLLGLPAPVFDAVCVAPEAPDQPSD
jgi:D-glycero-D-manno-heptose 1,7-bisphosphate phosphatase